MAAKRRHRVPAEALRPGSGKVVHAGTRREGDSFIASGGRVLTVVAQRSTLAGARAGAYDALARVTLAGGQARSDIALAPAPART